MDKFKKNVTRLFNWLMEPWPLHIFPVLVIAHLTILYLFPTQSEKINGSFSALFQLTGGLMILWILSINLGIITRTSLFDSFCEYFKKFPFIKRKGVFLASNINAGISISPVELKVTPQFNNLEEKVNFIQSEILRLEENMIKIKKEAQEKIKETEKKLMGEIVSVNSQIEETNSKIKNIVAGGAKWEVLGVLNVSYGLIIPLVY